MIEVAKGQGFMGAISLFERAMTDAEFARINTGFDEHTREQGSPLETSERHGFVALDGEKLGGEDFVGCASGLAYKDRAAALGVTNFWTFTAGYEAPGFYQKQGYQIIFEQENWYATGHSRVALQKMKVTEQAPRHLHPERSNAAPI